MTNSMRTHFDGHLIVELTTREIDALLLMLLDLKQRHVDAELSSVREGDRNYSALGIVFQWRREKACSEPPVENGWPAIPAPGSCY